MDKYIFAIIVGLFVIFLLWLIWTVNYKFKYRSKDREIRFIKQRCKHEEKELLGGGGELNSGWVYKCKKCGTILISD